MHTDHRQDMLYTINPLHIYIYIYTVGRINFKDKKFRGFRGYLLNLEIKYPCNFLYTRPRFFVQHVVNG